MHLGLHRLQGILIPSQGGQRDLRAQAARGRFLSNQLLRQRAKHTAPAQAKQGGDGHRFQGHSARGELVTHCPGAQLQPSAHTGSCTGTPPAGLSHALPGAARAPAPPAAGSQRRILSSTHKIAAAQQTTGSALPSLALRGHELLRLPLPLTHIKETAKNSRPPVTLLSLCTLARQRWDQPRGPHPRPAAG